MNVRKGFALFVLLLSVSLVACASSASLPTSGSSDISSSEDLKEITEISFPSATYTYDGSGKSLTIVGTMPSGVGVSYTNNAATNAGSYNATAVLSGTGYQTLTLNAILVITKADISGISFSDSIVEYDSLEHSIVVIGDVPSGVVVTYSVDGQSGNSASEVGQHSITATLESTNHNQLVLTAVLTIYSLEERLFSTAYKGNVLFQNNLDSNRLYKSSGSSLTKVCGDIAHNFVQMNDKLYYFSKGLLASGIVEYDGSTRSIVNATSGDYLTTDGAYLYYSINNLLINTDKNGIYKYDVSEGSVSRLTTDKAESLAYSGGYIYYSNASDGGKLYRIQTSANLVDGTKIIDYEISELIADNGVLYFNQHGSENNNLGIAIYKYVISSREATKLTMDAGRNLQKIGSYLYYINYDLLTSHLYGDGVYKINLLGSSLPGQKVITGQVFSMSSDGNYVYYYKTEDKHFYRNNPDGEAETDLMEDFVVTETNVPTGYAKLAEHNGEIYYTNMMDDGALYKYNAVTKANYKVTALSVSGVYFNGEYMYYTTYILTNYALFRVKLSGGEPEKICSDRCENLVFFGSYIYYIDVGVTTNRLCYLIVPDVISDVNTVQKVVIYDGTNLHIESLAVGGSHAFFCTNPAIGYKKLMAINLETKVTTTIGEGESFVLSGTTMYFHDQKAKAINYFPISDLQNIKTLASNCPDVRDMVESQGHIIFSGSYNGKIGFHSISTGSSFAYQQLSMALVAGILPHDTYLYFLKADISFNLQYPVVAEGSSGHLFRCSIDGTGETQLN